MFTFDWDEGNLKYIARHGVSKEEAEEAFNSETLELGYLVVDDEDRFDEVGATASGRVLRSVTILRGDKVRVVTAFDAPKPMRFEYFRRKGSWHE